MASWYVNYGDGATTGYYAVTKWATLTAYNIGDIRRQNAAPAVGSERVFRCTTAGTSLASEPTWNLTAGSTTADGALLVWTEITGNATYNWTAPHARLANAFASGWGAAGDDFYVAGQHAETQASAMTLTSPGTAASPCRILCVNQAGTVPPVSADLRTTAMVSTTGTSTITTLGNAYCYGVTFTGGNGASNGSITISSSTTQFWTLDACSLVLGGSSVAAKINIGSSSGGSGTGAVLNNTTVSFTSTSQQIAVRQKMTWRNTASAVVGTVPTTLFTGSSNLGTLSVLGVDLSALGSGKNLVDMSTGTLQSATLIDCKLGSSVSITTGSVINQAGTEMLLVNCDSADTNYRYYRQTYQATEQHETTIVRSGGATDGVTSVSRKIVTTANSKFYSPYQSDWMLFWNSTTGSAITVAIPVITDNVTLKDNDCWIEVEGLGTSGFPLGTFATDAPADVLNAGTNQTTDATSSWTTTGLTTPVLQVLSTTFTPRKAGFIRARVCVAKVSTTVYYDPAPINGSWVKYNANEYVVGQSGSVGVSGASGGMMSPTMEVGSEGVFVGA